MAVKSPLGQRRLAVVREIVDAVNRRHVASAAHHVHPDVEVVLREGSVRGKEYFIRFFEAQ